VIKKLDKLIIKAFIGPFIATFLISLFVLVMQFFWLYIDDLVGKGLDVFTIFRLIGYVAATAVPLALPLALLLSSIMTFGNLGENFQLVAIKSAGIPLIRFMMPLLIISVLISGVAFLFANNIIPVANLKLNALKYDIIVTKPALDIKEGVFYDKIEGYVIKVGKKDKDDSTIHNIVLYQKKPGAQDDFLVAYDGVMKVTPDKRFLEFTLRNGWNYQENGNRFATSTDFIRLGFKEYKKDFDLSSFQMINTEDSLFKWDPKMLTVHQLNLSIDSIKSLNVAVSKRIESQLKPLLTFYKYRDSAWTVPDSLKKKSITKMSDIIPDSLLSRIYNEALSHVSSAQSFVQIGSTDYLANEHLLRSNRVEWNRKFTLSIACIVLFMIGAPLGSIIRKGGLGSPLVFSVIFFVLFHLLDTFGEKFAKQGVTTTFTGMWLSTFILIPVGIFLISKAMSDSQLFNKEFYFRLFKQIKSLLPHKKSA
jgi:lipopolysaccharide export system permease protein